MSDFITIHEFRGESFRVAVRRHRNGLRFRVTILANDKPKGGRRRHELECGGSREVFELLALLKPAAVMVQYLEDGGTIEIWN